MADDDTTRETGRETDWAAANFREKVEKVAHLRELRDADPRPPGFDVTLSVGGSATTERIRADNAVRDDGFIEFRDGDGDLVRAINERFVVSFAPRD